MIIKTVVYDPNNGKVWPDATTLIKVREFLEGTSTQVETGSEMFCYYIRAYYATKDYDFEVEFEFENTSLSLLKSGRLEYWPEGFGSYLDNAIEILL